MIKFLKVNPSELPEVKWILKNLYKQDLYNFRKLIELNEQYNFIDLDKYFDEAEKINAIIQEAILSYKLNKASLPIYYLAKKYVDLEILEPDKKLEEYLELSGEIVTDRRLNLLENIYKIDNNEKFEIYNFPPIISTPGYAAYTKKYDTALKAFYERPDIYYYQGKSLFYYTNDLDVLNYETSLCPQYQYYNETEYNINHAIFEEDIYYPIAINSYKLTEDIKFVDFWNERLLKLEIMYLFSPTNFKHQLNKIKKSIQRFENINKIKIISDEHFL